MTNRCLAHIINLATQALIATRSKAKYYSPDADDAHIPDLTTRERDEVGLVRAICVKARSSSQRKELFKSIQVEKKLRPLQLLLDMKVRWGSTYVMLMRAEERKEVRLISAFRLQIQSMRLYSLQETAQFVYQLSMKETNHEKHLKLGNLTLSPEEWTRVRYLTNLLEVSCHSIFLFSSHN